VTCSICGAARTTTAHDIWYASVPELQEAMTRSPHLHKAVVHVCVDCVAKDTNRFRRAARKAPIIVGASVAATLTVGVTVAVEVLTEPRPGLAGALVAGLAFGVFAGGALAGATALGLSLRMDQGRVVQGLVVANADRLGLTDCIGFWLKRPMSFSYGGRNWHPA